VNGSINSNLFQISAVPLSVEKSIARLANRGRDLRGMNIIYSPLLLSRWKIHDEEGETRSVSLKNFCNTSYLKSMQLLRPSLFLSLGQNSIHFKVITKKSRFGTTVRSFPSTKVTSLSAPIPQNETWQVMLSAWSLLPEVKYNVYLVLPMSYS